MPAPVTEIQWACWGPKSSFEAHELSLVTIVLGRLAHSIY